MKSKKPKIKCRYCFGKGYYSKIEMVIEYPDFISDVGFREPPQIKFYRCKKCRSRKKLPNTIIITIKYEKTKD